MASAEKFRADTFKSQDQKRPKHVLTPEQLRVSFAYAKMAVKDEVNKSALYNKLEFVEFLEFLCRSAICVA